MPDRLEELAKQMRSGPNSASVPAPATTGANDVDLWGASGGQTDQPGFFENLGHAFGIGTREAEAQRQEMIQHPVQFLMNAAGGPALQMAEGLVGGAKRSLGELGEAYDAAKEGNGAGVGVHAVQAIPLVGSAMKQMVSELPAAPGRDYNMGDITRGNVGTAVGTAAQIAPIVLGGADAAVPGRPTIPTPGSALVKTLRDPLRAYRSPAISDSEAAARSAADIIKPNPAAYRGVVSGLTEHAPAIKDFAASTGNKFKTPLDFAKAAKGAGQESSNFFKEHLIDPNAELPTPHGTVAEVHQRLGEINDELRPAYRQRTGGQELSALERKNLETERDALNNSLYNTLSERSGLPVDTVRGINRRGGALQSIGDEADSAQAMRRSGFSGYTPTGLPIPMTMAERGIRLAQYLRGGPEAVAGRQLSRVLENVKEPATPLPDPEAITSYRRMAEQSDLGNLRRALEGQEQNKANSTMRRQTWRTPAGTASRMLRNEK